MVTRLFYVGINIGVLLATFSTGYIQQWAGWGACFGASCIALLLGVSVFRWGYRYFEDLPWIDALLNASMILGGMGPVGELKTVCGKLFASFYALFSGMVFLVIMGVLFAPVIHRFLHRFHLEGSGR